ncbi:maltose O-acetyltransferase [Cetobacterium ceti]|uniref:Maltose O-acetyltransferase n=1 Tax=Cetobacterium ceti TaxID=180163 RepID=A0A1T4LWI0_9FUSO|nr:acyltransferase [Cetobacterium ceti]SJZ58996.1 maltose O-acetyltransferase [Cetobacterium ceti]
MYKLFKIWLTLYRNFYKKYYLKSLKKVGNNVQILGDITLVNPSNIEIGNNVTLNPNVYLNGDYGVKIGSNCSISAKAMIISTELNKEKLIKESKKIHIGARIEIGDYVQIGAGAIILKGVKIGNNCIIGAGAIVKKDVPPQTIVYGNPLKFIKI